MKGTHPRATKDIFQLKLKPIEIPTIIANKDSIITAVPSVLAPFKV
jgi:hypothetical protein